MAVKYNSSEEYLEQKLKKKQQAILKASENGDIEANEQLDSAQKEREKSNRAANADYLKYVNPYGYNAEDLAKDKLSQSGITQSNKARAYQSMQNRVSENQSDYSDIQRAVSVEKLKNKNNLDSSLTEAEADYYDSLYAEYWKNKNFDYEKSRDAISDERYEREWAYKLANASRSSSSSSSSRSSSSSSNSSSNTYVHTNQSALSNGGISLNELLKRNVTASAAYVQASLKAQEATGGGSTPASKSVAEAILSEAKSRYVSTEQLNEISRHLACQ